MWAESLGELLYWFSELLSPGDKPQKRRRVILIFAVAIAVSTTLALIAFTDVL